MWMVFLMPRLDLQQSLPGWCARQEPAPALAEAEERLKGALAALATLKAQETPPRSDLRSPICRTPKDPQTPSTTRWQRSRRLRGEMSAIDTSPSDTFSTLQAVTPTTGSTRGSRLWAESVTPMKMARVQPEDRADAASLRATSVVASNQPDFCRLLELEELPVLKRQRKRIASRNNTADQLVEDQRWLWQRKRKSRNLIGAPYVYVDTGSSLDGWWRFFSLDLC
eukprot:Skav230365  [mRNA]  locus=scaffold291:78411:84118:- [translate_table: standard]